MMRRLVVFAFAAAVQVSTAGHSYFAHEEVEPLCGDASSHFCADPPDHHDGPCAICRHAAGGMVAVPVEQGGPLPIAVRVAPVTETTGDSSHAHSPSAPRAPPTTL